MEIWDERVLFGVGSASCSGSAVAWAIIVQSGLNESSARMVEGRRIFPGRMQMDVQLLAHMLEL